MKKVRDRNREKFWFRGTLDRVKGARISHSLQSINFVMSKKAGSGTFRNVLHAYVEDPAERLSTTSATRPSMSP